MSLPFLFVVRASTAPIFQNRVEDEDVVVIDCFLDDASRQ
jgi:hypothetical protein